MSWETLKVGDFVVPFKDKYHKETRTVYDGYSAREVEIDPPTYDAVPAEIIGIALPYIVLRNVITVGGKREKFTVDLRRWDVMKCDREYVSAFVGEGESYIPVRGKTITNVVASDSGSGLCPMCRDKMISFRPEKVEVGYSNWALRCKKCKIECREYK